MTTTLVLGGTSKTGSRVADSAYVTYYPDVSFPGAGERVAAFARTAVASGVQRLVLLSGRGEPDAVAGVPAEEIEPLSELFARVLDGHNEHLSDDVELVLGRRPRDFADYAHDTAATGVWSPDKNGEIR